MNFQFNSHSYSTSVKWFKMFVKQGKNKILGFFILSLSLCISCTDDQNQMREGPSLAKIDYGGCFRNQESGVLKNSCNNLYYAEVNDTLHLYLSMYKNCGTSLSDSVTISSEDVNIYIRETSGLVAFCNCNFEFDYSFTDFKKKSFHFYVYYKEHLSSDYYKYGELEYLAAVNVRSH